MAAPVGLAIDDEFVRGGREPVHSGLCQQHVGHEAESLILSPVGSDHCGRFLVAFDDQLVRVGRLGRIEAVRPEDVPGIAAGIGTLVAGIKWIRDSAVLFGREHAALDSEDHEFDRPESGVQAPVELTDSEERS